MAKFEKGDRVAVCYTNESHPLSEGVVWDVGKDGSFNIRYESWVSGSSVGWDTRDDPWYPNSDGRAYTKPNGTPRLSKLRYVVHWDDERHAWFTEVQGKLLAESRRRNGEP